MSFVVSANYMDRDKRNWLVRERESKLRDCQEREVLLAADFHLERPDGGEEGVGCRTVAICESLADNILDEVGLAALKEKLTVLENEKFLDKLLRESKLPMTMTKKFREALGEKIPAKKEEIEAKFKLFREGAQAAGEGDMLSHLVIQPEKTGEIKGSIDFSDCVK